MFVKEMLNDNPLANAAIVNDAWRAAVMLGGISVTFVSKIRSRMGLSGNLGRGRGSRTRTTRVRPGRNGPRRSRPDRRGQARSRRGKRSGLSDLEVEIDRLLMKVVENGTLPEVENALRNARRQLY